MRGSDKLFNSSGYPEVRLLESSWNFGIVNWNLGIGVGMLVKTKFQNSKNGCLKFKQIPKLEPRKSLIYKAFPRRNSKIPKFQQI